MVALVLPFFTSVPSVVKQAGKDERFLPKPLVELCLLLPALSFSEFQRDLSFRGLCLRPTTSVLTLYPAPVIEESVYAYRLVVVPTVVP